MLYITNDPLKEYRPQHLCRVNIQTRYQVTLNGEPCVVRLSQESRHPFNRVWPGHQRPVNQTEQGEFIVFYGEGPVEVKVTASEAIEKAVLRPMRHGIAPSVCGDTASFTLPGTGYYSVEFGSTHQSLQIFYCKPIVDDGGEDATYCFGPGIHFAGKMHVKSGDRVYIHPEAVVYGSVYGEDVENVEVYGGGVLDDSTEERVFEDSYGESSGCIRFFRSNNIRINNVILLNASNWVLSTFNCNHVYIDGVKILGQWRYNTDGIDLVNAAHCFIRNCFVRSFDDTIALKALYQYPVMEDIVVEDCVVWCGWGKTLEIGLETSADEYRDIHYRNIDCIHNSNGVMAISNGNYAFVHDITYENITVEYAANEEAEIYQNTEEMVYEEKRKAEHALLFKLSNWRMAEAYPYIDIAGEKAMQYGVTDGITYRDITVFCEDGIEAVPALFVSNDPEKPLCHLDITNLVVNGEKQKGFSRMKVSVNRQGIIL